MFERLLERRTVSFQSVFAMFWVMKGVRVIFEWLLIWVEKFDSQFLD